MPSAADAAKCSPIGLGFNSRSNHRPQSLRTSQRTDTTSYTSTPPSAVALRSAKQPDFRHFRTVITSKVHARSNTVRLATPFHRCLLGRLRQLCTTSSGAAHGPDHAGSTLPRASQLEHVPDSKQGHPARTTCSQRFTPSRLPLPTSCERSSWHTGHSTSQVSGCRSCSWLLLAPTRWVRELHHANAKPQSVARQVPQKHRAR